MDSALTAAAFLLLIAIGAYLIHRLNAQHAGKTATHTRSGGRASADSGDGSHPHPRPTEATGHGGPAAPSK